MILIEFNVMLGKFCLYYVYELNWSSIPLLALQALHVSCCAEKLRKTGKQREKTTSKMTDWNLWKSIEWALRVQFIFFVSPFYCDHQTGALKTSLKTKLYMILVTIGNVVVMYRAVFHWNFLEVVFQIIPNQFVWKVLCIYFMTFMGVHFVLNAIIILIQHGQQMDFLERIHSIDQTFLKEFHTAVDHQKYKRNLTIAMGAYFMFCIMEITSQLTILNFVWGLDATIILSTLSTWWPIVTMEAQMYTSANYLFLIERRYRLVYAIYKNVCREYNQYQNHRHGITVRKIEKQFASKLSNLFELFREITGLTKQYGVVFGSIFASILIKTFLLMSVEMYSVVIVANDESVGENQNYVAYAFLCMICFEMMKLVVNAIAVHSIYAAVRSELKFNAN